MKPKKNKVGQVHIEPPELKFIPELLPIFVELIGPMLRPRSLPESSEQRG
jgi:hypothetical protein